MDGDEIAVAVINNTENNECENESDDKHGKQFSSRKDRHSRNSHLIC